MNSTLFVKPAKGVLVRHKSTFKPLLSEGEAVPNEGYYRRLLAAGDLIIIEPPKTAAKK